jgi:palmitoyltransferase
MGTTVVSVKTTTKWATRVVPFIILLITLYSIYVVVARLCIQYILIQRRERGIAVALLVLFFVFLILSVVTYLRTFVTVKYNAGLVPLPPRQNSTSATNDTSDTAATNQNEKPNTDSSYGGLPDDNPDSPGLETFYRRDVFVCESDGRPKWCHSCRNWKPDRAHHSSELERCVLNMDHFCPWVGGMVAETSYKYFTQFVFYVSCFLAVCLAAGVYCLVHQKRETGSIDGQVIAAVVLSAFFAFFAIVMSITAFRLVLLNITSVDSLRRDKVTQLAIRVPLDTPTNERFHTVTYPLPHPSPIPSFLPPPTRHQQPQPKSQTSPNLRTRSPAQTPPPTSQNDGSGNPSAIPLEPLSDRDRMARRTFAVVRTEPNENPWDLGYFRNWKAVMGNRPVDWLLPIRPSPCTKHDDDMASLYPMGPALERIKRRYGLDGSAATAT